MLNKQWLPWLRYVVDVIFKYQNWSKPGADHTVKQLRRRAKKQLSSEKDKAIFAPTQVLDIP